MYAMQIKNILGDRYTAHQVVTAIFPVDSFIFSFDKEKGSITAVSKELPNESALSVFPFSSQVEIEVREFNLEASLRKSHMFSLTVNASRRNTQTRKYHAVPREDLENWLGAKLSMMGARLVAMAVTGETREGMLQVRNQNNITLHSYMVAGCLEVVDGELFASSWFRGIGRGRCFGFGMLSLS